jgi:hypothetical protein
VTRTWVWCPGESGVDCVERATTPAHNRRFVPGVYRAVVRPVRADIGSEGFIAELLGDEKDNDFDLAE